MAVAAAERRTPSSRPASQATNRMTGSEKTRRQPMTSLRLSTAHTPPTRRVRSRSTPEIGCGHGVAEAAGGDEAGEPGHEGEAEGEGDADAAAQAGADGDGDGAATE